MTEVEQHLIENVDGKVYYNCAYQLCTFNEKKFDEKLHRGLKY